MGHEDLLLAIAQIAVAFAGFAGLVSMLSSVRSEKHSGIQSLLFRTMILMALTVLTFSLVPFVPNSFGLPPLISWRIASALFLIGGATGLYVGVRYVVALADILKNIKGFKLKMVVIDGGTIFALLLLGLNTVGVLPELAAGFYITSLFLFLMGSGITFVALLFSYVYPVEPARMQPKKSSKKDALERASS